jgi:hypothetical protein
MADSSASLTLTVLQRIKDVCRSSGHFHVSRAQERLNVEKRAPDPQPAHTANETIEFTECERIRRQKANDSQPGARGAPMIVRSASRHSRSMGSYEWLALQGNRG